MPELPSLACPKCKGVLEYHATIEMIQPPIGRIDTGYCTKCRCMFECVRQTNTFYDSTLWPPLCRACRQPVAFIEDQQDSLRYGCREHANEQWLVTRSTDHWSRVES